MKIPRQVLGKIGKCIYCGETEKLLRTEHIIPYGLNGPWELLEASCEKCAAITSAFELTVLKDSLIVPRVALDFPTRRKGQRPKKFNFAITRNGRQEVVNVPIQEHFAVMILQILEFPAYLDGRPYKKGVNIIGAIEIQVGGPPIEEIIKRYGTGKISTKVTWHGNCFERMLAKIAYGFSVAYLGVENLEEVYILPAILGQKDDVGRWVGTAEDIHLDIGKFLHHIELAIINEEIIVRIKLFALFNVPEYLVVVGRVAKHFLKELNLLTNSGS